MQWTLRADSACLLRLKLLTGRCSKAALNAASKSMSIDLERLGMTTVILHPGACPIAGSRRACTGCRVITSLLAAGWVRTELTGGDGLIDVDQSVSGLLSVIETTPDINGKMFDYKQDFIGW